jgi:hypothetical protein
LPHRSVRSDRAPAHIGEALPADAAAGNPEGSPSDPVTTDPKGEASGNGAARNTPALIKTRDAYGAVALDPWFVTGLAEGEGCFCISFSVRRRLKTGLEVRPSFALSLNERDLPLLHGLQSYFGCGSIRESRVRPHFQVREPVDVGASREDRAALRGVSASRKQTPELQWLRANLPDDRTRRSS